MNNQKETKMITLQVSEAELQELVRGANRNLKSVECVKKNAEETKAEVNKRVRLGRTLLDFLPDDHKVRMKKEAELKEMETVWEKDLDAEVARLDVLEPLTSKLQAKAVELGIDIPKTGIERLEARIDAMKVTEEDETELLSGDNLGDALMGLAMHLAKGRMRGARVEVTTTTHTRRMRRPDREDDNDEQETTRSRAKAERNEEREEPVAPQPANGRGL